MVTIAVPSVEKRVVEVKTNPNQDFLTETLRVSSGGMFLQPRPATPVVEATRGYKVHYLSRNQISLPEPTGSCNTERFGRDDVSLFVQALHSSFAEHVPFTFSPEMAWYLIAHEVAVHISLNQDLYRGAFTSSADEEMIEVRDDSLVYGEPNNWARSINKVRDPMKEKVPQRTIELMLPAFSSASLETETSLLVLFLNVLSHYYQLRWQTLCGIPSVNLTGTPEDWRKVVSHAELASSEFDRLSPYFSDLLPVLGEISQTASGEEPDPEFWESIYKYKNESGGPYVSGWIASFLAHYSTPEGFVPREEFDWRRMAKGWGGLTTNVFPSHVTLAPFTWNYYDQELPMAFAAGVFGVDYEDGSLSPKLGFGVLEDTKRN